MEPGKLLAGKKALITGASRGIGKSVALAFVANGAKVCLVSRKSSEVEALAKQIGGESEAYALEGDVSDPVGGTKIGPKAIDLLGGLDSVICAAGYPFDTRLWNSSLDQLTDDDFSKVFNTDVLGSLRVARSVIPYMVKQKSGVFVLFSSTPAVSGFNKGGPYTIAKSGVRGLAKEIASEYGEFNVRAYAIAPGNIKTDATYNNLTPEQQSTLQNESPMKRWGNPSEIASVCVVLASDAMSFVTGQTVVVDGGTVML
jgi:3-oxoacyl-[acyl-carrier protein] reductase